MHLFSVVIPALNEEDFLPRLLTDLKNQTQKNFEVIVVDASSQDKTKEAAQSFRNDIPVMVYTTAKKNVSYSRNYGAEKSKGAYLIFLDADTRLPLDFIKNLDETISREKALLYVPYLIPEKPTLFTKTLFGLTNLIIGISNRTGRPLSSSGSMICEANLFRELGGFNEELVIAEDHDLVHRAMQRGVRARFTPSVRMTFSLRRVEKEGKLTMFYKYVLVTIHLMFKGNLKKKMFEYEMGGQIYKKPEQAEVKGEI